MQFGWNDVDAESDTAFSQAHLTGLVEDADRLAYKYLHIPAQNFRAETALPTPKSVNLVMPLRAFEGDSARTAVARIRRCYDRLEGRLALKFCARETNAMRTSFQILETLLTETAHAPKIAGLALPEPQPEVLMVGQDGSAETIGNAAARGFHVISPDWQPAQELARHWPRIVAGSTHAAIRACPKRWHVARNIFITDSADAAKAYAGKLAKLSRRNGAADQLIAGSVETVARHLRHLRTHIGPFGVLHCTTPGLGQKASEYQRHIFASEVLPALMAPSEQPQMAFERQ